MFLKMFLYLCSQNILELKVYDENAIAKDDLLFTVLFDVAKIQLGETVRLTFQLDPKVRNKTALARERKYIFGITSCITSCKAIVGERVNFLLVCTSCVL